MNLAVSGSLGLYVGRLRRVASYVSRDACAKGGESSSSITPSHQRGQRVTAQPIVVTVRGWVVSRVVIGGVVTVVVIQGRVSPHLSALSIGPVNQVALVGSQAGSHTDEG